MTNIDEFHSAGTSDLPIWDLTEKKESWRASVSASHLVHQVSFRSGRVQQQPIPHRLQILQRHSFSPPSPNHPFSSSLGTGAAWIWQLMNQSLLTKILAGIVEWGMRSLCEEQSAGITVETLLWLSARPGNIAVHSYQ